MQKNKKTAFSLVELSIVILIVSILITGSLSISKTAISNSKSKVTKERMDTVYQAFTNFLATNRRLPCPALLTVAKGTSTYGDEAATPGTCTSTYVSSTNAPNLSYGMVPTAALGLDPDMAEDGFGTKFTYVVDKRFTKQSATLAASDGFEVTQGVPSDVDTTSTDLAGIDVEGPSGSLLLSNMNGVFLLLSHGANKFNGFNATSTAQNGTSTVTDENDNSCNTCSTSGTTSFDRIFLTSSTDPNFDDVVLFKTKTQLVRDAGLKFIMCSLNEATTTGPITWTLNGAYGCAVCASTANNNKTCGSYGIWGTNSTTTCTADTTVCLNLSEPYYIETYNNGTQSLADSTDVSIIFGTELVNKNFGTRSDTTKFQPPLEGYWLVNYTVVFVGNANGNREAGIIKNGSATDKRGYQKVVASNSSIRALSGSSVIYFNGTTDYIEITARHNRGSSLNVGATYPSEDISRCSLHFLHS